MKRIEIGDIGKFFKEEHEDLLRLAVLTLDTRIKTVSPVDLVVFVWIGSLQKIKDQHQYKVGHLHQQKMP